MPKNTYGNDYDIDLDEDLSDYDSQESGPPPPPPPLPPQTGGEYAYDEYNVQNRSRSDFDYSMGGSSRMVNNNEKFDQNEIVKITGSPSNLENSSNVGNNADSNYKDVDTTQDMFFEEDQSVEIGPTKIVEDFARRETDGDDDDANRSLDGGGDVEKRGRCSMGRNAYIGIVLCLIASLIIILGAGFGTGAFLNRSAAPADATADDGATQDAVFAGNDGTETNGGLFNVGDTPSDGLFLDPTTTGGSAEGLFPNGTDDADNVPVAIPIPMEPVAGPNAPTISVDGGERGAQMLEYVSSIAYDGQNTFVDRSSPESLALDFLILEDPLQLDASSPDDQWRIAQRFALLTLWYNSGPLWANYTNWLVNEDECTWYGIGCNEDDGRVVVLNLEENNIYGRIPNDLALLSSSLVSLSLAGNRLEGILPPSLQQLTNLQELWLDRNLLGGTLEEYDFGPLSENLSLLDISSNNFRGNLPESLFQMNQLSFLVLDNNRFTGPIYPSIGGMTSLQRFTASNNQLTGSLVSEMGNLANLQVLWLFNNSLSGPLFPEVSNMASLSTFDVVNNRITGRIPTEFATLPGLAYLNLGVNNMTGPIPEALPANLLILNIESNQLTGNLPAQTLENLALMSLRIGNNNFDFSSTNNNIPRFIYGLDSLRELRMNGLGLQGIVQEDIDQLVNLVTLQLQDNQLGEVFPWQNLISSCEFLETLNIGNNQFTGQLPADLTILQGLRFLDLHMNQFNGNFPEEWAFENNFVNLQHLDLGMNRIGGPLPALGGDSGNLAQLTSLMIPTNELTGVLPEWIGENLLNLQVLDVSTNRFVGGFPESLVNLRQLQTLNMHLNYFSSQLPENIGDLGASLTELRLHTNIVTDDESFGFRGTIPTSVGQLLNLRILELYTNLFEGPLPTEIGLCQNLVVFDVEYNRLNGQVPSEYGALTNLQEFYLSNTDITGIIPTDICVNPPQFLVTDCDVVCSCCTNCVE